MRRTNSAAKSLYYMFEKVETNSVGKDNNFDLYAVQEINRTHSDSIWVAKFSPCGSYFATGGKDACLKVWVVNYSKEANNQTFDASTFRSAHSNPE